MVCGKPRNGCTKLGSGAIAGTNALAVNIEGQSLGGTTYTTTLTGGFSNDGGDITFRGFKDGVVYLNMKGSCAGCPSSTATLQHGIQNLLKHFVPDVVEVRPM